MSRSEFDSNQTTISIKKYLFSIEAKIEKQDYPSASQQLEVVRTRIAGIGSRELAAHYMYLSARCLYHQGSYSRSLIRASASLRLAVGSIDDSLYGSIKQLLGLIFRALGRLEDAIEAYTESIAFKKRAGVNTGHYGSYVNIGLLHFQKGNLQAALESLAMATKYSVKYNTPREIFISRYNCELIKVLAGRFSTDQRLRSLNSRIDVSPSEQAYIELLIGMTEVFLQDSEKAASGLSCARSAFEANGISRSVAVCLEYLGLNEYFAGNYAKAREYYDQVLAMPEPTASAVAQTLRMLTDVEIAEGNWDAAKTTAARADVAINKISERIELSALWRAYGHIHTHDNDYAKAREYFEKSIDLLRQLGARYELALSHFDAGRSCAYSPEEQIEQLKAAKALFVEMGVPKRVAQVDEVLSKITSQGAGIPDKKKRSLTLKSAGPAPVVVATSRAMRDIMELADRIKNNDMTVLITGETGTGKDLLAEYLHSAGNRCEGPFKAINCAAMPESLLELELFGARKGTFTGSTADKPGLIESADGGTFYFDEIGDAPATIQSKLLRAIETKTVRRLGSNEDVRVNVRFVAATNHDLQERIASKEFRRDLYYRLAEVEIKLPPLRDRREDVMPLISQFLKVEEVELTTEQYLQLDLRVNGYDWPGNVREVRRLVKLATATATNSELIPALESALDLLNDSGIPQTKAALIELLARHNGNISSVARELGIPRTTLVSHLKKFGLL